jgi:hypothetical protein
MSASNEGRVIATNSLAARLARKAVMAARSAAVTSWWTSVIAHRLSERRLGRIIVQRKMLSRR